MTDADLDEIDQFSDKSRTSLQEASAAFIAEIQRHTVGLLALRGGSAQMGTLFQLNDDISTVAKIWEEAVLNHTGTSALCLDFLVEEDDEDVEDDDDDEGVELVGAVSVISRWDLAVTSVPDLISAGRAAHRRLQPDETEADAAVAIDDEAVGQALYALCHEFGEPWFDLPGVELAGGKRAFLQIDPEDLGDSDDDGDTHFEFVPVAPDGDILYSESW